MVGHDHRANILKFPPLTFPCTPVVQRPLCGLFISDSFTV